MTKVSKLLRVFLLCACVQGALGQAPSQIAEEEAIRRQEKAILLRSIEMVKAQGDATGAILHTHD